MLWLFDLSSFVWQSIVELFNMLWWMFYSGLIIGLKICKKLCILLNLIGEKRLIFKNIQSCGEQGFYLWGSGISSFVLFSSLSFIFFFFNYIFKNCLWAVFFPPAVSATEAALPLWFLEIWVDYSIKKPNYWYLMLKKSQ